MKKSNGPFSRNDASDAAKPLLTEAQAQVLKFIKDRCRDTGISPSYREIQMHLGYKAIGTVQDHIKALRKKGMLAANDQKRAARGLIPQGQRLEGVQAVSIYGEVAAGTAREVEQIPLGTLFVPENYTKASSFALRIAGNSMIEAGIFEGDYVIVERTTRVKEGDIIVALLDGETTVKRYSIRNGKIFLVPENRSMKPIPVESERFEIQGRVVGLQRKI
jgi:repressor LexA